MTGLDGHPIIEAMKYIALLKLQKILVLAFICAFSAQALGFSCIQHPYDEKIAKNHLALQRYSPFPIMTGASILASVAAFVSVVPTRDENSSVQADNARGSAFIWLISGMLWGISHACPIDVGNLNEDSVTIQDLEPDRLAFEKDFFEDLHLINSLPPLFAAMNSSKEQRWPTVAAALVFPWLVDWVLRATVSKDRVSPWTLQPQLVQSQTEVTPLLSLSYRW